MSWEKCQMRKGNLQFSLYDGKFGIKRDSWKIGKTSQIVLHVTVYNVGFVVSG